MGFIKYFDLPEKADGQAMDKADRTYLIKLIVVMGIFTFALTMAGVQLLLERHIARMGNSAKSLMEWSKKADLANEMLGDMFKVQQTKEAYESQGIGAEEIIIKNKNKEANNENIKKQ